jgi:G3E family GTPase
MILEPLPALVTMRPMVLLSGFLGSGKTTFLRDLLNHLPGHRLTADVILNDYENADLDAETLQQKAASISPLSSSCACCSGLDDLVKLALTAQSTRSDALLIELNGTADPIPLLESFTLLERKLKFRPRWQVAIIDARHFGQRGYYNELEIQQLQTASHYVLSHTDSISKTRREDVQLQIRHLNPHASRTTAGRLSTHLATAVTKATPVFLSHGSPKSSGNAHRHGHPLAHSFTGCQILLPNRVRKGQVKNWLTSLPETVIRAKALVTLYDQPECRQLFERVGLDFLPDPIEVPISGKVPASAIFIGPDLQPEELLVHAQHHFGPTVSIPDDE